MFVVTLSNFSQQNKADVHTAHGAFCMDCRSCGSKYPYFGAAFLEICAIGLQEHKSSVVIHVHVKREGKLKV